MSLTVNPHLPLSNFDHTSNSFESDLRESYNKLLIDYNNMKQITMQQKLDFLQLRSAVEIDLTDSFDKVKFQSAN